MHEFGITLLATFLWLFPKILLIFVALLVDKYLDADIGVIDLVYLLIICEGILLVLAFGLVGECNGGGYVEELSHLLEESVEVGQLSDLYGLALIDYL